MSYIRLEGIYMGKSLRIEFTFLCFFMFLCFSIELVHYQQCFAILIAKTNQIAQHLQRYGYEKEDFEAQAFNYPDIQFTCQVSFFDEVVEIQLHAQSSYVCLIDLFSFMENDMQYELKIYQ